MADDKDRIMVEAVKAWKWRCPACCNVNLGEADPPEDGFLWCSSCESGFGEDEFLGVE